MATSTTRIHHQGRSLTDYHSGTIYLDCSVVKLLLKMDSSTQVTGKDTLEISNPKHHKHMLVRNKGTYLTGIRSRRITSRCRSRCHSKRHSLHRHKICYRSSVDGKGYSFPIRVDNVADILERLFGNPFVVVCG